MSTFTIPEPIAGDPDSLIGFAAKYKQISAALQSAANELSTLANVDITVSLAVDGIRSRASDAYVEIIMVSQRYGGAAATYATYASKLRDAQHSANSARATIAGLKGSADHAKQTRDALIDQAKFTLPNQQTADDLSRANSALAPYQSEYATAMHQYNQAVSDKAVAVSAAIAQLEDAQKMAGRTDNFFEAGAAKAREAYDWAKKNLTPYLKAIRAMAKVLASIIDVIAMFVSIVNPVVGRAIAGLSLALSALALLCSLSLYALGEGSIGAVIADSIGVAAAALNVLFPGALGVAKKAMMMPLAKQGLRDFSKAAVNKLGVPVTEKIVKKVVGDLARPARRALMANVLGTAAQAIPGSGATIPDATADVTSDSWKAEAPLTGAQDVATAGIKDVVSAMLPGADIVFGITDDGGLISSLSATGS
jgi:hypothetical protein